jgi:alpha-mannosidase
MNDSFNALLNAVEAQCWTHVAPLTVTVWKTPEPVPFTQRKNGNRMELQPGDTWGDQLFDCAWFHFQATLPESCHDTSELALRIDANGELLLTDNAGTPLKGLTSRASVFARELGIPLKTIFQGLDDITSNTSTYCKIECWADAGYNDLFGSISADGSLLTAEVVAPRPEVRALYYDIEVLLDATQHLPKASSKRNEIQSALENIQGQLGDFYDEAISQARQTLAPFFSGDKQDCMQLSAVGHAHLDLAWLWPIRETFRKGARTFATALYLIERYPDYIFAASQPQLFAWMQERYPELYQRIKAAVTAGRIEPQGAAWVECDMNLVGGESIVRQLLYGRQFFRDEFGVAPDYL